MLDHILRTVQHYEREHRIPPNVVYLNPQHFNVLRRQCPGLFCGDPEVRLGFRLVILPASVLLHPQAACVPPAAASPRIARVPATRAG